MYLLKKNGWLLILVLVLAACTQEKEAKRIPVSDFFKNPEKTAFSLSPDGKYICYLQPYKNRLNIFVQTIDGKDVRRITSSTDRNISYYFWGNNEQILFLKDKNGDENPRLYAVNRQ